MIVKSNKQQKAQKRKSSSEAISPKLERAHNNTSEMTHIEFAYMHQLKFTAEKLNKIRSFALPEMKDIVKKHDQEERDRKRQALCYKVYLSQQAELEFRNELKKTNEEFVNKLDQFKQQALEDLEEQKRLLETKYKQTTTLGIEDEITGSQNISSRQVSAEDKNRQLQDDLKRPGREAAKIANENMQHNIGSASPINKKTKLSLYEDQYAYEGSPYYEYLDHPFRAGRQLRNRDGKLPPGAYTGEMISNSHQRPEDEDDDLSTTEVPAHVLAVPITAPNPKEVPKDGEKKKPLGPTAVLDGDGNSTYLGGKEKITIPLASPLIEDDWKDLIQYKPADKGEAGTSVSARKHRAVEREHGVSGLKSAAPMKEVVDEKKDLAETTIDGVLYKKGDSLTVTERLKQTDKDEGGPSEHSYQGIIQKITAKDLTVGSDNGGQKIKIKQVTGGKIVLSKCGTVAK